MNYQVIKVGDKVIEPCSDGIRFGITDGGSCPCDSLFWVDRRREKGL